MVLNRRVQAYYEENPLMVSSPFGGVEGINRALLEQTLRALDIPLEGKRVLDVGCGRGYAGDVVRALGGAYTGMDFVASRAGFPLALGNASALPFRDGAFNVLFCIDAFEHFPEPERAAAEFRRVLRPEGCVFLSVPNYANIAGAVKCIYERVGWYAPDTWAPFRHWQPQELEHALTPRVIHRVFRAAGFETFRRIAHAPETVLGLFPWLEHPKMPEAVKFRLQRLFFKAGPAIARLCPNASLHHFWRIG